MKKSLLSHPLSELNSLIFVANDKAVLMVDPLEQIFTTNLGLHIPDITEIFYNIKSLKIIKSNLFTSPRND